VYEFRSEAPILNTISARTVAQHVQRQNMSRDCVRVIILFGFEEMFKDRVLAVNNALLHTDVRRMILIFLFIYLFIFLYAGGYISP